MAPTPKATRVASARKQRNRVTEEAPQPNSDALIANEPSTPIAAKSKKGAATRSRSTPKTPAMTSERKSKRLAAKQFIESESSAIASSQNPQPVLKTPAKSAVKSSSSKIPKSVTKATPKTATKRSKRLAAKQSTDGEPVVLSPLVTPLSMSKSSKTPTAKKSTATAAEQSAKDDDPMDVVMPVFTPASKSTRKKPGKVTANQSASKGSPGNVPVKTPKSVMKTPDKSVEKVSVKSPKSAQKTPESTPGKKTKLSATKKSIDDLTANAPTPTSNSTPRSAGKKLKKHDVPTTNPEITPKTLKLGSGKKAQKVAEEVVVSTPTSKKSTPQSRKKQSKKVAAAEESGETNKTVNVSQKKSPKTPQLKAAKKTPEKSSATEPSPKLERSSSRKKPQKRTADSLLKDSVTIEPPTEFEKSASKAPSSKKRKKLTAISPGKPGKFDLVGETPERKKSTKKSKDSTVDIGNKETKALDSGTPDVTFHKKMSRAKADLLEKSPLSTVVVKESVDCATEEILEARLKGVSKKAEKRKAPEEVEDMLMLDVNAEPSTKKSRVKEGDGEMSKLSRKEERKLKRKVRDMGSRGELLEKKEREVRNVGVMYLGHLPHGFFEREIRGYFSQFGEVRRVHVSRSKKTARSRGYAFVEFGDKEVAAIAADAMDGYLMHGKALVAKFVPAEKVHEDTFKGCKKTFKKVNWSAVNRHEMLQRSRDPIKMAKRSRGIQKKSEERREKLAKMGLKYEFPTVTGEASSS